MSERVKHESDAGWAGEIAFSDEPDRIAYRRGEMVVRREAFDAALRRFGEGITNRNEPRRVFEGDDFEAPDQFLVLELAEDLDPIASVDGLREDGFVGQPNHALFASYLASPVYDSGVRNAHGRRKSTARPAPRPSRTPSVPRGERFPVIAVLDTGIAADSELPEERQRPDLLQHVSAAPDHFEHPDEDRDAHLDRAAGHGTFIAGIIELHAPGCEIIVKSVLTTLGVGYEDDIAAQLRDLENEERVDLVNLSFGGYTRHTMQPLADEIGRLQERGVVVVAAAGNDGESREQYPAAFQGVVSVGALDANRPAEFSNRGPWVRACAPGVDLVSSFFRDFEGPDSASQGAPNPDRFQSWAQWSGTSFATPVVVAALAREMQRSGCTANEAVSLLIDEPGLDRIADLGTVVNPP